jgi:hypothetical protein
MNGCSSATSFPDVSFSLPVDRLAALAIASILCFPAAAIHPFPK